MQLYVQRLGCQLQDVAAVRKVAGIAFALAMDALYDLPVLQFPPSLLAAALLFTARKTQVRLALGLCRDGGTAAVIALALQRLAGAWGPGHLLQCTAVVCRCFESG